MISAHALHLGIFMIPWSLVIILAALAVVFGFSYRIQKDQSWSIEVWQAYKDSLWVALWVALISARLVFILSHYDAYFANPIDIIKIQDKGFNLYAGALFGSGWFYWKNRHIQHKIRLSVITLFLAIAVGGNLAWQHLGTKQQYPSVTLMDLKQQSQTLSQYSGKPSVINLWASWCPPCHREMPVLHQAQSDYSNIQFIMINQGETAEAITEYLQRYQFDFHHVLLDPAGEVPEQTRMFGLPSTLFFDAGGQLVERHLGELSPAMLQQYLQKITSSPTFQKALE